MIARCSTACGRPSVRSRTTVRCRASTASIGITESRPVVVTGAGIAGLATAVALRKVGVPVLVLESAEGKRSEGAAIGVWTNGFKALDALGVADHLRTQHPPLERIELSTPDGGKLQTFPLSVCAGGPHEFRGVRRAGLLSALEAQLPPGTVRYGAALAAVREPASPGAPVVAVLDGGEEVEAGLLVGADGVRSEVAQYLGLPAPTYQGYTAIRGLAKFKGRLPLPRDTCRQVLGQGVRAGMYPVSASECYWYTCFNAAEEAPVPPTAAARKLEALASVAGWRVGIVECIEATAEEDISRGRIVDRWAIGSCGRGRVTLVGDAAHPMTPNLGQGGCVALEDAVELARTVAQATAAPERSLEAMLRDFESQRAARAFPITVRANLMGAALQLPLSPVCAVRNWVVANRFNPVPFLNHATYDCGQLAPQPHST